MRMGRFFALLRAQIKRGLAVLPPVLGLSLLFLAAVGLLAFSAAAGRADDTARQKLRIGVVGEIEDDAWLRMGFYALEHLDDSRYALDFVRTEETAAARKMRAGKLNAYLVIPDGFAEAVAAGRETEPIRFVFTEGAAPAGTALAKDIVGSISRLLLETERTIYGAQDYVAEHLPEKDPYAAGDALVAEYLSLILTRDALYELEIVGLSGGIGFVEYYLSALTVLLLMLWGVACAPLYSRKNDEARRMLTAGGLGPARQLAAEYLTYLMLLLVSAGVMLGACGAALALLPELGQLLGLEPGDLPGTAARALVPALMLAAGQLLLAELASGTVSAMLLQFLAAAGMGYCSGCFYPASFFPETLRRLGAALPSGVAFGWMSGPSAAECLWILLYAAAFLLLLYLLLRRKCGVDGA